jgi:hypothetical protein
MNRAEIVFRLLGAGSPAHRGDREEEGKLIQASLQALTPPRVFKLFARLAKARVNNRRTRAVVRDFLKGRRDPAFDAVKYRSKVKRALRHVHISPNAETGRFLFGDQGAQYDTPLYESYRSAHFSQAAVYDLPYTVAEGFAAKHGIPREKFLAKIEPRLTAGERLRLQRASAEKLGSSFEIDLGKAGVTRLALYVLSLPREERLERQAELDEALRRSAGKAASGMDLRLGRVACVLDRSFSSSGSAMKRRRPLAVALGTSYLIDALGDSCQVYWTTPLDGPRVCVTPKGQTNLIDPLIDALRTRPDLVVILSDGHENDPSGGVEAIVRAYRRDLDPEHRVSLIHVNPVFDAEFFEPRSLGPSIPTVGVRDAEDLATMLAFARFVDGGSDLAELETFLAARAAGFLGRNAS